MRLSEILVAGQVAAGLVGDSIVIDGIDIHIVIGLHPFPDRFCGIGDVFLADPVGFVRLCAVSGLFYRAAAFVDAEEVRAGIAEIPCLAVQGQCFQAALSGPRIYLVFSDIRNIFRDIFLHVAPGLAEVEFYSVLEVIFPAVTASAAAAECEDCGGNCQCYCFESHGVVIRVTDKN